MPKKVQLTPTLTNEIQRKKLASGVIKNAINIGAKKLAWIPTELLNIQPYQRGKQRHVVTIAENWDDAKCNVLLVSYDEENGCFNVMDGQHRSIAARMRGVEYLVCEIFSNLTMSKEASMFVDANISTKKLNPFDTYKANQFITAEDETELSSIDKRISAICKKNNVTVAKSNAAGTLKSVPVARKIMRIGGENALQFVFSVISESHWDTLPSGYGSDIMDCLWKVYYKNQYNLESVKKKLCDFFINSTPNEIEALGNNNYPNLSRRRRLDSILTEIINEKDVVEKKVKTIKVRTA